MRHRLRRLLRASGFDIVRVPIPEWAFLRETLLRLLLLLSVNCVLDVGAHTGEYGDFLRDIGYDGWIVSFEPVEDNFETLRRRTAEDSKWSAYQFALGAEEKSMAMNVTRSRVFSSFHEPNAFCKGQFQERGAVERRELVTMRRLDRVFDEVLPPIADPRVYLKMDTQGWDLQVLEGATGMLDRVAGLQSEVSVQKIYSGMPGYLDSLAVMERLGFELVELVPVSRKDNLAVIEFDALMIRRAGMRASPSPALRHQDFALNPKA